MKILIQDLPSFELLQIPAQSKTQSMFFNQWVIGTDRVPQWPYPENQRTVKCLIVSGSPWEQLVAWVSSIITMCLL